MSVTQGSKYGTNDNPMNEFYQPYYARFHACSLFSYSRNSPELINAEVVSKANAVLREMYERESEKPELRSARHLMQKDGVLFHNYHPLMYELIRNSGKFHKVFFVKQPELFALIMGLDTRSVKVHCYSFDDSDRQGQFELEFQGDKSDTVEYHRTKVNPPDDEGFTHVRGRRPRPEYKKQDFRKPEYKPRYEKPRYDKPRYEKPSSDLHSSVLDMAVSSIKSVKLTQDQVPDQSTPFSGFEDVKSGSSWATMSEENQTA
jgi:hypothetical protein